MCNLLCFKTEAQTNPVSNALQTSYTAASAALLRCVKKGTTSGEARSVGDSLCDQEEMPPSAKVCFLACPKDCVIAPWGPWSNCPLVRNNSVIECQFFFVFFLFGWLTGCV